MGVLNMTDYLDIAKKANWVLLALTMLAAGLLKVLVIGPGAVQEMLAGFGFPAAGLFAWVLILSEIASGALILAKYKLEYVTWLPVVILVVATFTAHWGNWANMLVHLALASNYVVLGQSSAGKK